MKKLYPVRLERNQIQELEWLSGLINQKISKIIRKSIDEYMKNKKKAIYKL
jgi:hypothetical protein